MVRKYCILQLIHIQTVIHPNQCQQITIYHHNITHISPAGTETVSVNGIIWDPLDGTAIMAESLSQLVVPEAAEEEIMLHATAPKLSLVAIHGMPSISNDASVLTPGSASSPSSAVSTIIHDTVTEILNSLLRQLSTNSHYSLSKTVICRAHSFSRKMIPNSAGQFTKLRGSLRQNCPNSAAYRGLPFVRKLSSILLKNFTFWKLAWCSVMLATYRENYPSFFLFRSAICQLVTLCLFTIAPYYHGNY